jgi:hypothetical protein
MNSSELDLYSKEPIWHWFEKLEKYVNMNFIHVIRVEIFVKHGCFWIECQTSAPSKLSSNLIRGVEWHFLLKVNYDIVIFLNKVDDNNIIIVFMSLSLKFCISDKFCIKVINFQREDKDQDALLMKESLSSASEK